MAQNQKSYDNEYKAQAVKLAQEIGGHKAAQELGIPKRILVMVGTKKALAYAVRNVTVTSKADTCYGRNEEGTGLCSTECNRNQEKYTS